MTKKIFSISEAAKYLGVSSLTLRNWEKKGSIKTFYTLGGHRRFRKSELDKILGISGAGDKLKKTIKELEKIDFKNGREGKLNRAITDLKNISDEL